MKYLKLTILTILLLLTSCLEEQVSVSPNELARLDSLALHVAVMPVMDCLPIYYAQSMGMFEDEGLNVVLNEFLSKMDCDTALLRGRCEMAYTDLIRIVELQTDTLPLRAVLAMQGKLSLVTARTKRIRTLKHLHEHMVALDRLSIADYWSDELMKTAGLEQTAIYRPQINNIQLCTYMLNEQLLDAALLPEPYATQAVILGNRRIFTTPDSVVIPACMAIQEKYRTDSVKNARIETFIRVYDRAVEQLNNSEYADTIRAILISQYVMPEEVVDTLEIPKFPKASIPASTQLSRSVQWLKGRERRISARSPLPDKQ